MAKLRSVNTHFWSDNFIADLDPIEKLLFLYLITNPLTTLAGCYEISERRIAFDTGIDKDMVIKILERFQKARKLEYREGWIVLTNFLSNQSLNDNMRKNVLTELAEAPEWVTRAVTTIIKSSESLSKGFPTLPKPRVILREDEDEVEGESEAETEAPLPRDTAAETEEAIATTGILKVIKEELGLNQLPATDQRGWSQHFRLALKNGFTADNFIECFKLLRAQSWRTSAVKPKHVTDNLPNLDKIRNEVKNGKAGKHTARESVGDRLSGYGAIVDKYK